MRLALAWFALWALRLKPEWQVRVIHKGERSRRPRVLDRGRHLRGALTRLETCTKERGEEAQLAVVVIARRVDLTAFSSDPPPPPPPWLILDEATDLTDEDWKRMADNAALTVATRPKPVQLVEAPFTDLAAPKFEQSDKKIVIDPKPEKPEEPK